MSDTTNGHGIVRLSLNVPAVERLIAGDQELELHLRHQVHKQVFDNTLTSMMDSPAIKALTDEFRVKIDSVFREECAKQIGAINKNWHTGDELVLTPTFKALLDKTIRDQVEPTVVKLVKEQVQFVIDRWMLLADAKIDAKIDANVENRIQDGINQRLAAAAAPTKR